VSNESDKFRKERNPQENVTGTGGKNLAGENGFKTCKEYSEM
jgi:hypothetical protein